MLHVARAFGAAAPHPIAIAEIHALCSILGIVRRSERLKYLRLIQLLDGVFLAHWAEKNPPQGKAPPRGHKN